MTEEKKEFSIVEAKHFAESLGFRRSIIWWRTMVTKGHIVCEKRNVHGLTLNIIQRDEVGRIIREQPSLKVTIQAVAFFLMLAASCGSAFAEVNIDRLADAIYKAENSKAHPYGIMVKYKKTSPRQACKNTIRHALRDFKGGSDADFIQFLGNRYAPRHVENDPTDLNANWVSNVNKLYKKMA